MPYPRYAMKVILDRRQLPMTSSPDNFWCLSDEALYERTQSRATGLTSAEAEERNAISAHARRSFDGLPRKDRSALRITATSISSCSTAPCTGEMTPNAAAIIPAIDMPIPAYTLCSAMIRELRAISITGTMRSS
jgi:hypothetical protein